MSKAVQLTEISRQIEQYVRRIKNRQNMPHLSSSNSSDGYWNTPFPYNDLVSNINKLDGENKFNIQTMTSEFTGIFSTQYAATAYEHLSAQQEDKNKVIIDLMHKNNRKFDVQA